MPVRIVTIPFNHEKAVFEDEDLCRFLLNKQVKSLTPKFFQVNADAYWTVFIEYEPLVKETEQPQEQGLTDLQKTLLDRLKQWRAEKAQKEGVPVFIIATNKELIEVVKKRPVSIESLRQISGFGKKKIERHGKDVVSIVTAFSEKKSGDGLNTASGESDHA